MKRNKFISIILMTVFGLLGSIIIGYIFRGSAIFNPHNTSFQFVMSGLYGALFFSLLEYEALKVQVFAMLFIFLFQIVIFSGRFISMSNILRDFLFLGGLFLSLKLYHDFIKRNPRLKYYLRCFALVLFYGIINLIVICIILLINGGQEFPPMNFLYSMSGFGILIGLGIGLGLDVYLHFEKQIKRILNINPADLT